MRRILLSLVGLAMLFGGSSVAMAHGPNHWGGYRHPAAYRGYYRPYPRGGFAYAPPVFAGYAPGYAAPGCGVGYGVGYGAGYAYPQAGFGVSTPGFSLFVR